MGFIVSYKMEKIVYFQNSQELSSFLVEEFRLLANKYALEKRNLYVAISGGNSPQGFFRQLAFQAQKEKFWNYVHFYWVDERCVPKDHPESNYRMAKELLLKHIPLPESNVHPIFGDALSLPSEILRYTKEIKSHVPLRESIPLFDWIFLGMGSDGHTASIFPGQESIIESSETCTISEHPHKPQKRITLTLKTINNARRISFLVLGKEKERIIQEIFQRSHKSIYPASYVVPQQGTLEWLLFFGQE